MTIKNFGLDINKATEKVSRKNNRHSTSVAQYAISAKKDLEEFNNLKPSFSVIKPGKKLINKPKPKPVPESDKPFLSLLELAYPRSGIRFPAKAKLPGRVESFKQTKPVKRVKRSDREIADELAVKRAEKMNKRLWGI